MTADRILHWESCSSSCTRAGACTENASVHTHSQDKQHGGREEANDPNWSEGLFNELNEYWAEIADVRPTEKEVMFIEKIIEKKGLLLDLCCGTGRHSIVLRKKGWNVVGFDVSGNLLRIAREKMGTGEKGFSLVKGEMRRLPFQSESFDAVISMFTSFGYLPSQEEDMKSFREVVRVLKTDGIFLLDVVNRDYLIQIFRCKDWAEFPHFYMLEKRVLDDSRLKLHSQWTLLNKNTGESRTFVHNLRLYTLAQLQMMLQKAGITIRKVLGGYEGQGFRNFSPRLIVVGEKKDAI